MTYAWTMAPVPLPIFLAAVPYATPEIPDMYIVERIAQEMRVHLRGSSSITIHEADVAEEFSELLRRWRADTQYSSTLAQRAAHPAYRAIVALGEEAIPLILRELRRQPDFLLMALREITQEDPVRPESRGRLIEMVNAWLQWGAEHGYHA